MDEIERDGRDAEDRRAEEKGREEGDDAPGKLTVRWGKVVRVAAGSRSGAGDSSPEKAPRQEPSRPPQGQPSRRGVQDRRENVRRRERRLKGALALSAALVAILSLQVLMGGEGDRLAAPPVDILGTWETDDPRYEGTAFVLRDEELEIQYDNGTASRHEILSIRRAQMGDSWEYAIIYASPEGEMPFDFVVHPGGILRLKNPADMVWRQTNG